MKTRKRLIALLLVVYLMISMVPVAAYTVYAADQDYEEMYGITYEQLFTLYPGYLNPDSESYITRVLTDRYVDALDSHSGESTYLQSFLDVISNKGAMEIVIDTILEGLNLAQDKEEKLLRETIYLLMNNIYIDENTTSTVLSMIDDELGSFGKTFDVFDKYGKDGLIEFLQKHTDTISNKGIESIVNQAIKDAEEIQDHIGFGIEICDVIQAVTLLNEVQRKDLILIQESVPKGGTIYRAIDVILDDMDQNLGLYISEHYLTEKGLGMIAELIECNAVAQAADSVLSIFKLVGDHIFKGLLNYATATEMNHTVILSGYVEGLRCAVLDKRIKFIQAYRNNQPMGADDLQEYEFIYAAYVAAIKTTLEAASNIAKNDNERGYIDQAIELCDKLTFEKYLQLCLVALRSDIDTGVAAAPTTDIGFPEWCIKATYPASGTLVITKDNANIMDRPCSVNTDMNARCIEKGKLGAVYTVTASCTNIANNTWYQIITKSGEKGYIYSENCAYTPGVDVTLTGVSMPTTLAVGSRHYIQGTISTQYSLLLSVSCNVYDMSGNWKTGGTVDVNGKSYVLDYSAIDAATEFNILGVGTYRCEISAMASSGSTCEKIVLYAANLTVYDPSAGSTTVPDAQSAEFITRNDGVWLWPLSREAYNKVTDWAGCNGDWSCPFPGHSGNNHGGCLAPHETADGLGHNGIDIGTAETVYAMAAGTAYTREDGVRGKYIVIEHPIGIGPDGKRWAYYTYYQHLNSFAVGNGAAVDAGTPIGVSGNTGLSTAAHLHVGMVLGHCDSYDAIGYLESKGWVLTPGFQEGRIVNNPARNSPAGYPTGYYVDNLYLHAGSVMYTFTKADIVIGEGSPKECPHSYVSVETAPTCDSAGYITYTCSVCGDSYVENPYEAWSEWTTSYPVGMSTNLIRTRTEYRHQDKEFTTSTGDSLPGWVLDGPTTIYGDYGEWSAWSDSLVTESDIIKVETRTVWPYYYFLCSNCGAHMHGYGTCWTWAGGCGAPTYDWGWREVWSTTPWDSANLQDWLGTGKYYTYINGELVFKLVEAGPKTQYRYCTREAIDGYSFYRWGEWSDWSAAPCTSSDTRNAEARTAYRYYTGPLADHSWDEGVVTKAPTATEEGICSYTCIVCNVVKNETIPTLGVSFDDVAPGTFYYEPVMWAAKNGVTSGTSATTFDPSGLCLRAHVVTFLYRAAGSPVPGSNKNPFTDVKSGDFYYNPVLWAVENGITQGISKNQFGSTQVCNRAAVVTFLWRAFGSPEPKSTNNPFVDVKNTDFFYKPVLWAVENGITAGIDATHFNPAGACNRAQVVTFLYRAYN